MKFFQKMYPGNENNDRRSCRLRLFFSLSTVVDFGWAVDEAVDDSSKLAAHDVGVGEYNSTGQASPIE